MGGRAVGGRADVGRGGMGDRDQRGRARTNEGFGSVFAALVLLSVGVWMHGKAQADQWQRYIHGKMSKVLSGRSAWLLFLLAFIVVYREVFETILFLAALWTQGNAIAMLLGALGACLALALITWVLLRFSQRLPIGRFFAYSSWLMAILAVVLIGKGVGALQEAGIVDMEPLAFLPRVAAVGLYPTVQTVLAQVLMILGLLIGFGWNRHHAVKHATSGSAQPLRIDGAAAGSGGESEGGVASSPRGGAPLAAEPAGPRRRPAGAGSAGRACRGKPQAHAATA